MTRYRLSANVSSDTPGAIAEPLSKFVGAGATVTPTSDGFEVTAEVEGDSARELNRRLLTELRRAERRTRLRAEWTSAAGTERFFDYVPKGLRRPPA